MLVDPLRQFHLAVYHALMGGDILCREGQGDVLASFRFRNEADESKNLDHGISFRVCDGFGKVWIDAARVSTRSAIAPKITGAMGEKRMTTMTPTQRALEAVGMAGKACGLRTAALVLYGLVQNGEVSVPRGKIIAAAKLMETKADEIDVEGAALVPEAAIPLHMEQPN